MRAAVVAAVLGLCAGSALGFAPEGRWFPERTNRFVDGWFPLVWNESTFVGFPALIGAVGGGAAGGVVGAVCALPVYVGERVYEGPLGRQCPRGERRLSNRVLMGGVCVGAQVGHYVTGTPFYLLKFAVLEGLRPLGELGGDAEKETNDGGDGG